MAKQNKIIRELKRISNKLFGTKYPLNSTNKIAKTCWINKDVTFHSNITVGDYTHLNQGDYIFSDVQIGNYCSIAVNVIIGGDEHNIDTLSQFTFRNINRKAEQKHLNKETIIESDVWIGAGAIIKKGIKIGTGAVVGSGSVVTKDVPPFAIVVGVPARILRYRFEEDLREKILESKWWTYDKEILDKLDFNNVEEDLEKLKQLVSE